MKGGLHFVFPPARAGRLLILIYHRVRPSRDSLFPGEVDEATFNRHMLLVRQFCRPLPLLEAIRSLYGGTLPPTAVCVTFDDGYADNEAVALPILLRHGVPATFFIATGYLDGGRMWNDTVIEALRKWPGAEMDLTDLGLGRLALGHGDTRGRAVESVLSAIKHRSSDDRDAIAARIAERAGQALPSNLMMTSQQVRCLVEAGMEIGAHTVSHPILARLSEREARAEMADCRTALERITGQSIRSFAYPNGRPDQDYIPRDRELVKTLGFDCAVSTKRGVASAASDRFQLPRFTPWDRVSAKWLLRLLLEYRNVQ